ncbi:MAG: hypothetical protein P8046_09380 [Anaerolineales bacterium]
MRTIELILSVLTIFVALQHIFGKPTSRRNHLLMLSVLGLVGVTQLVFEGFRWQLWPLFVAIGLLAASLAWGSGASKKGRVWLGGISLVLVAVSLAGGWLLPVPDPYPITGPYQVGTTIFPLADESRMEIYGPDASAPREIMVQVWYPAESTAGTVQAQWMPDIDVAGPAIAEFFGLPSFSLTHLKYVHGNAYLDAPAADSTQGYPLLVFSHGWSGFKEQNIYQVEELASHGYVVVGIDHTYGAIMTVFPDGRQMPQNEDALPEGVPQAEYDQASNRLVRQWAGDIGFVLDELIRRDAEGEDWALSGRLDFDKIGIFGHSTGGGATAEFCGTDPRCKAALMMDLWIEPVSAAVVSGGLDQPFLLMHSAAWAEEEAHRRNFLRVGELIDASAGDVTELKIAGSTHYDFTSTPLLTPLASKIGLKGPIPGDRVLALINTYTVAFFDQTLKGKDTGLLLPESAPFEEAQFGLRP